MTNALLLLMACCCCWWNKMSMKVWLKAAFAGRGSTRV